MSSNSFIKQYLAKQHELLRQRLEREARGAMEPEGEKQTPTRDTNPGLVPNGIFPGL